MSLEAMKWALQDAPIPHSTTHLRDRLVLVYLADRHNIDTGVCWPSLGRIANDMGITKPTVRNAFRSLEELGLIEQADPGLATGCTEGRKPTVWRLNLDMARGEDVFTGKDGLTGKDAFTPDGSTRVYPTGKDAFTPEVKTGLPKPKENPNGTQSDEPKDLVPADKSAAPSLFDPPAGKPISELTDTELQPLFEKFWDAHPQKAAKEETFKEFRKALKKTTFSNLVEKAEIYARWVEHEGIEWGAVIRSHNWLKGGRWDDELRFTDRSRPAGPSFNDIAGQMLNKTRNNGKELDW